MTSIEMMIARTRAEELRREADRDRLVALVAATRRRRRLAERAAARTAQLGRTSGFLAVHMAD